MCKPSCLKRANNFLGVQRATTSALARTVSSFRIVGRSAWSTCWSITETVLSTTFFVGAINTAAEKADGYFDIERFSLWVVVMVCCGRAMSMGVSHCLCKSRVHRAVNEIKSRNARDIDRLEDGSQETALDLDCLDLYEYHDVVTMAVINSRVILGLLLVLCFGMGWGFCLGLFFVLAPPGPRSDPSGLAAVAFVLSCSWLAWFAWSMRKYGVVGKIRNCGEACRVQPFHVDAPALLLVPSVLYALFLCFFLAPSVWKWSLIATHTARVFKVLAFLCGRIVKAWKTMQAAEGVAAATRSSDSS